jgi:transposase
MNAQAKRAQKNLTQFRYEELTFAPMLRLRSVQHTTEADFANLPDDSKSLKAMVSKLLAERDREKQRADHLHIQMLRLQVELERFKKFYYGPRADQLHSASDLLQLLLQFAQELEQKPIHPEDVPSKAEPICDLRRVKRRRGRRHLANFDNLPATTHVHELKAEERVCPGCGVERKEIGAEESWQVEYIPGRFERIRHVRKKYACAGCEANGENPQIKAAAKPETAIDKGMAGPGLLAYIVTSKFSDYLPLYRLENIFERIGCEISRATMCVWCGDVADLIEPLYELMATRVRQSRVVCTDDTPMPMLQPGKGQTQQARMWIYLGDERQPYNVFHFTESRKRDGPLQFLRDYGETLVADAYGGYDGVVASNTIRRGGCHAHARRKFVEAERVAPEIAREAVELYRSLYQVERRASTLDAADRLALRQKHSASLMNNWKDRLRALRQNLLPKNPMAEAVNYSLNHWDELTLFLEDGAVPIDNNASEREMKRQVLNRKNSLFVGNARGGRTAAILSSFTATCRRHEIDPQLYFTQLLVNLPAWPMSDLQTWLPDQWKLRQASMP